MQFAKPLEPSKSISTVTEVPSSILVLANIILNSHLKLSLYFKSEYLSYSNVKTVNFNLVKAPVQSLKKTITKKYFETPGILITSGNNINNTPISDDISPSYLNENNCFENKLN